MTNDPEQYISKPYKFKQGRAYTIGLQIGYHNNLPKWITGLDMEIFEGEARDREKLVKLIAELLDNHFNKRPEQPQ